MAADDELKNSVNERIAAETQYTSVLSNLSIQLKTLATSTSTITKEQNKLVAELKKSKVRTSEGATIQQRLATELKNEIEDIKTRRISNPGMISAQTGLIDGLKQWSQSTSNDIKSNQIRTQHLTDTYTSITNKLTEDYAEVSSGLDYIKDADASLAENARKILVARQAMGRGDKEYINAQGKQVDVENSLHGLISERIGLEKSYHTNLQNMISAAENLTIAENAQAAATKDAAKVADAIAEFKNKLKTVATGLQRLGDDIKGLADAVYKTQQKFGASFDTAATIAKGTLIESAKSYFRKGPILSQAEIMAAGQSFMAEFGKVLNPADMARIASEAKKLGVTSDIYVNSRRAFLGTGNEEAVRTRAMSEFAKAGLSAGQALQFAAENADLVAVAGDKYAGALFRAAADAKKIGVNLGDVEKFANNLVGDFEGSLEKFAEVTAMGVELDVNQLAAASATGNPEDMINELKKQFTQSGITGEELQNSRQLRLALTQATGMTESAILRLAGQGGKPEEKSMTQQQLDAAKDTNTLLGKLLESGGAIGGIIAKGVTAGLYIANTSALFANTAALISNLGGTGALLKTMGSGTLGKMVPGAAAGLVGTGVGTAETAATCGNVNNALIGGTIGTVVSTAAIALAPETFGTSLLLPLLAPLVTSLIGGRVGKGDDILSSAGYGARSLVTPTGTVALNNNDTVMAGTKLMSPGALTAPASTSTAPVVNTVNVDMSKLEARFDKLASSLGNLGNMKVEMDGHTVGRVSLNASSPLGRLAVVG
jgi:hypothetical protein